MKKGPVLESLGQCASLLAALVLAAMGLPLGVQAEEDHKAGLVVQFGDGRVETRCITFEEEVLNGAELLARSGLEVVLDPASSMGVTVCQIEGEGCEVPVEACFCQCMGGGECAYWNYFYRDDGEGEWAYSALGAALRKVSDGSVEAWVWGDGGSPPADELRFETICAEDEASTPNTPKHPTPEPATASPMPEEGRSATAPTVLAANGPTEEEPSPVPYASLTALPVPTLDDSGEGVNKLPTRPADSPEGDSGSSVADYWPFGLMAAALVIVGLVVWRRQS
jgi:hypothetical protein